MPRVERHLLALGPADRRKRFLSPFGDSAIIRYVRGIDPDDAVIVGAADLHGRLIGIAEANPVGDAPRTVGVAVSVHPYHRREGLGRRLVAQAVALAFAEGAGAAVFQFAPENQAIAGLVAGLGAICTWPGRAFLSAADLRVHGAAPDAADVAELAA